MRTYFSIAARPQLNGKVAQVSFMIGSNPDPKSGNMQKAGEIYMEPHEWAILRQFLKVGMRIHNAIHHSAVIEIMDGFDRGEPTVEFTRDWGGS